MEHVVDGGQADVLVYAAVAGDVVRVEQLVVVLEVVASRSNVDGVADVGVVVSLQDAAD